MKLKIFHFIPTFEGGGAERQLTLLATEQSKRGHDVHIAVRRSGMHEKVLIESGVRIHILGDFSGFSPFLILAVFKIIRNIRPDIVQTWLLQMDLVAGIAAIFLCVPWIATERSSPNFFLSTKFYLAAQLRKSLFRWANAIASNSIESSTYWKDLYQSGPKIVKINNAVNFSILEQQEQSVSYLASVDSLTHYKLLAVGRLVKSKGLNVVIEAVNRMPAAFPVKLFIIGDGPLYSDVESLITEYRLEPKIKLLPYDDNWWLELKDASLLVSMSLYEGQPNVVLETMAAGCPLVVSDIPSHREILSPDSALLVPVNDVDGLVAALVNALSDPVSSSIRALNARATIESFTIDKAADAYDELYVSVIKGGSV